jgi:GNAT superfamily N-acetyltransferase
MAENIIYRKMINDEANQVVDLVKTSFDEYVRSDLTEEGTKEFYRAACEMIYDRPAAHFIIVAESARRIIGMTDIRDNNHICSFYVAREFHGKGIGRGLLERAIVECLSNNPNILTIDVNSSLFAVHAYKKLGFLQTKAEQLVNGIRFVPMSKTLREATD